MPPGLFLLLELPLISPDGHRERTGGAELAGAAEPGDRPAQTGQGGGPVPELRLAGAGGGAIVGTSLYATHYRSFFTASVLLLLNARWAFGLVRDIKARHANVVGQPGGGT